MRKRLLLSVGFRAERSSGNGDIGHYFLYPKAAASFRFPNLLGEGSEVKLRGAYGETGNQALFGQKFTVLNNTVIGGNIGTLIGGPSGSVARGPENRPGRIKEVGAGGDGQLWDGRASGASTACTTDT